ncbi:hypothetical protein SAMN02745947_05614 [Rhodococcus rhodochrous J3]|uniref:Uncharacterized protein n=1 Tax=Rhodococcus rhodochrous J3 TaxID=903528 RepID=A0ABY1MJG3_RHORH|nr:hypothetical protein [Rhodococcus rhodochrous]MBF4478197.1 hypothetical protein [Rhodococcus rhodochrous]MCD2100491.1 hypothetical protein [Rhodococcus rhodochrous]MCD2124112.1 hypothetical protein [Rhodococcus rhodochrous]MCQ4136803.1 hypothetical protein [Rhodococcus rhodochrous]MDJ0020869.1 hypothetical protein [Rhodococcus rhodochrous]
MTTAPLTKQTKSRKWIGARLALLDPSIDNDEIVRLSTLYNLNDLQLHWFYAVGTPAAGIAPAVMDAVWRDGTGEYNRRPDRRVADSVDHMLLWFEHGADSAATKKSVQMVNKYWRVPCE